MATAELGGKSLEIDEDGFIQEPDKWTEKVAEDALHAFQWGCRDAIEHACMVKTCDLVLKGLEAAPEGIVDRVREELARKARHVPASTGLMDHAIWSYRVASLQRILTLLEEG